MAVAVTFFPWILGNGVTSNDHYPVEHDSEGDDDLARLPPSPNSVPNRTLSRHLLESSRQNGEKWFLYKMAGHGLGSVLMNLFYKMLYMEEAHSRTVIVSETLDHYRRSQRQGVLTGWFTPQMPVVDTKQQGQDIMDPILTKENNITLAQFPSMKYKYMHPSNLKNSTFIFLTGHLEYRGPFKEKYHITNIKAAALYRKLLRQACPHIGWNEPTQREMQTVKDQHGLPTFRSSNSVAFHVRRGDKKYESRYFHAEEYVERFLSIPKVNETTMWHYCYVATDDANVVSNMTLALKQQGIQCAVQSMASPLTVHNTKPRHETSNTLHFLTELSILQQSTLFVGSLNSNVGMLVSILRGCHQLLTQAKVMDHFGGSYGVNTTHWRMF
jgi:hypothetical protein